MNKKLVLLWGLTGFFVVGAVWYGMHHEIIVNMPRRLRHEPTNIDLTGGGGLMSKKTAQLTVWKQGQPVHESVEVVWPASLEGQVERLTQAWLTLLDQEGLLEHGITLQSAVETDAHTEIIVSFDGSPFNKEWSTYDKWQEIEAYVRTIRDNVSTRLPLRFLVHHQPMVDQHLDFSKAWPIEGFDTCEKDSPVPIFIKSDGTKPLTILLDPAGDAQTTGRVIDGMFERGITFQCAQALKETLEKAHPGIRVILTRFPGERVEQLQNATFANCLGADLYIGISCYQQTIPVTAVHIMWFCSHPTTDLWHAKQSQLAYVPYNEAHFKNFVQTKALGARLAHLIAHHTRAPHYKLVSWTGIPLTPLLGVQSPAIQFEIGIHKNSDWTHLIEPLSDSIGALIG